MIDTPLKIIIAPFLGLLLGPASSFFFFLYLEPLWILRKIYSFRYLEGYLNILGIILNIVLFIWSTGGPSKP